MVLAAFSSRSCGRGSSVATPYNRHGDGVGASVSAGVGMGGRPAAGGEPLSSMLMHAEQRADMNAGPRLPASASEAPKTQPLPGQSLWDSAPSKTPVPPEPQAHRLVRLARHRRRHMHGDFPCRANGRVQRAARTVLICGAVSLEGDA